MIWKSFSALCAATGESPEALTWLANRGQFARHYRTKWVPKRRGRRLLEAPLARLKHVQRTILQHALEHAPHHARAMAFRKGRGVLDHARLHAGRRWVLRMDLWNFFATIGSKRVAGCFRVTGFAPELARVLAELTTNAARIDGTREERSLYARRHLPQGAPTSPALANLAAWGLDQRLDALAHRVGGCYSRYADDLVLSSDAPLHRLIPVVGAIAMDEGFNVRFRKTRIMSAAGRQMVTGLVVNDRPRLDRRARKNLEALLYNCVRHGPSSQDRAGLADAFRAHLRGRVAHAEQVDPRGARRLVELFRAIRWE